MMNITDDTRNNPSPSFNKSISKSVRIDAAIGDVWLALTTQNAMQESMSDTPIEITTSWEEGSPFIIRGESYETNFLNSGIVVRYEPEHLLQYSHLSSLSKLPEVAENFTLISFRLTSELQGTILELTITNFPTLVIYQHFDFYWSGTLEVLKTYTEKSNL